MEESQYNKIIDMLIDNNIITENKFDLSSLIKLRDSASTLKLRQELNEFLTVLINNGFDVFRDYSSKYLSEYMFDYVSFIKKISIPDHIKVICTGAFYACISLTDVHFPKNLNSIESYAFYNCDLAELKLPNTVHTIDDYAFYRNTHIEHFKCPLHLVSIGEEAFCECASLQEIELNEGLIRIGAYAFQNTAIKQVTLPTTLNESTMEILLPHVFFGSELKLIYVKTDKQYEIMLNSYNEIKNTPVYREYASKIRIFKI